MSDIFISYRRGTASPYARGIYERLERQFGRDRVFMDIDTMEPGVDFVEYIQSAVSSCQVLIVVIGPDWVATLDDDGQRRLDDPDDFVRVEVTAAFQRDDVRVIPVLVGDAAPPKKADLPPELAPLTRRQALEVTDGRWDYDLSVLVRTIGRVFDAEPIERERVEPEGAAGERVERAGASVNNRPSDGSDQAGAATRKPSWFRHPARVAIAAVIVAVVGAAAVLLSSESGEDGGGNSPAASQESAAIPTANPCRREQKDDWMVTAHGAEEHHLCQLRTSPPPDDLDFSELAYGLFSSATEARKAFDQGLEYEFKVGHKPCPQGTSRRMGDVLGQGATDCFVNEDEGYISMWWNEDRSRVMGVLDFGLSTELENALGAWERVIKSH